MSGCYYRYRALEGRWERRLLLSASCTTRYKKVQFLPASRTSKEVGLGAATTGIVHKKYDGEGAASTGFVNKKKTRDGTVSTLIVQKKEGGKRAATAGIMHKKWEKGLLLLASCTRRKVGEGLRLPVLGCYFQHHT